MEENETGNLGARLERAIADFGGQAGVTVKNLATGESFDYQPDVRFSAASVIKLFVLWEFFRQIEQEGLAADRRVTLTRANRVGGSGVLQDLWPGLQPTLHDLATLMIIVSDNQATNMLIEVLGLESINESMRGLGLGQTVMQRLLMDHDRLKQGFDNLITAGETGRLLAMIAHGQGLSADSCARMLAILEKQQFNDLLPAELPEETRFAHKTGWLTDVLHDAGILFLGQTPIVVVALTQRNQSQLAAERFIRRVGRIVHDQWRQ